MHYSGSPCSMARKTVWMRIAVKKGPTRQAPRFQIFQSGLGVGRNVKLRRHQGYHLATCCYFHSGNTVIFALLQFRFVNWML